MEEKTLALAQTLARQSIQVHTLRGVLRMEAQRGTYSSDPDPGVNTQFLLAEFLIRILVFFGRFQSSDPDSNSGFPKIRIQI